MRAASLNFRDTVLFEQGGYIPAPEGTEAFVPFSDGCGIIEAVGSGVSGVAIGDRVSTVFFPQWRAGPPTPEKPTDLLGQPGSAGAGGDLALFPEAAMIPVPDFFTDEEVAILACAAVTA